VFKIFFRPNRIRESSDLIKRWLRDSRDEIEGTIIIHDDDHAHSEIELDTEFISKSQQHAIYPAEVHELLSLNDDGWHGPAKAK